MKESTKIKALPGIVTWPGGKAKELDKLLPYFPTDIDTFFDPFLGGGSVLLNAPECSRYVCNDLSENIYQLFSGLKKEKTREFMLASIKKSNEKILTVVSNFEAHPNRLIDILLKWDGKDKEQRMSEIAIALYEAIGSDDYVKKVICKVVYDKMQRTYRQIKDSIEFPDFDLVQSSLLAGILAGFYTLTRNNFNDSKGKQDFSKKVVRIASFLYLREFCYGGLDRVNSNGDFNVPFGGISYNKRNLTKKLKYIQSKEVVDRIKKTRFSNMDFAAFLRRDFEKNDFVFLDPPYDTDFSTYDSNPFGSSDQKRLAMAIYDLPCRWMLVVKDTPLIRELYPADTFNVKTFPKKYNVNIKNRFDQEANHLIIMNYE